MKIKNQVAFALSTVLLSVGAATVPAQSNATTARPPVAASPKAEPSPSPAISQDERRELQQRREIDRIRDQVQKEVNRSFGFTTGLLNALLFILILFPIAGIISLWLLRRSLATQIKSEVKQELVPEIKTEIQKAIGPGLASAAEVPHPPQPSMSGENIAQLKELISMAMATQNVILEARHTLEESLNAQTKTGDLLKNVFEQQSPQGNELLLAGRYEDAIEFYNRAIKSNPEDFKSWCAKGVVLTKMQRFDEAIQVFNQALRINSDFADAWYEKARCYAVQGNIESAVENLKRAIKINPEKREMAKNTSDFEVILNNELFQELMSETAK
ncbi:MAG: tetratricopeptide repeat protein [Oscillatoria sp. Prado101]|jgi:tetratricopeptide (TPR) repeat protein|nr:tetratricopeptide repeat protein [Oscillatoria sp. Prado101]